MKKHGHKLIMLLSLAVLCLFLAGRAVVPTLVAGGTDDPVIADGGQSVADGGTTVSADAEGGQENGDMTEDGSVPGYKVITPSGLPEGKNAVSILRCKHYNERDFLKHVNEAAYKTENGYTVDDPDYTGNVPDNARKDQDYAEEDQASEPGRIMGGIVPHHLLAGGMIASFFQELSQDPPETVVVIGPNHYLKGFGSINTSSSDWGTAFGILKADKELAAKLIKDMNAAENDLVLEDDHAVAGLVPYIKYYLPDCRIVPVLLHGNFTAEQSRQFGSTLAETISEKPGTIVIASIDFSHYLDVDTADSMDEITLKAIRSWDLKALSQMDNDNLDSRPSITTLLNAMDESGAKSIDVMGHNNSSRITGSGYDYTTSYFTMFFRSLR